MTAVTLMGGAQYWKSTTEPATDDGTDAAVPVEPVLLTAAVPVEPVLLTAAVPVDSPAAGMLPAVDVDVEMVGWDPVIPVLLVSAKGPAGDMGCSPPALRMPPAQLLLLLVLAVDVPADIKRAKLSAVLLLAVRLGLIP